MLRREARKQDVVLGGASDDAVGGLRLRQRLRLRHPHRDAAIAAREHICC